MRVSVALAPVRIELNDRCLEGGLVSRESLLGRLVEGIERQRLLVGGQLVLIGGDLVGVLGVGGVHLRDRVVVLLLGVGDVVSKLGVLAFRQRRLGPLHVRLGDGQVGLGA